MNNYSCSLSMNGFFYYKKENLLEDYRTDI